MYDTQALFQANSKYRLTIKKWAVRNRKDKFSSFLLQPRKLISRQIVSWNVILS